MAPVGLAMRLELVSGAVAVEAASAPVCLEGELTECECALRALVGRKREFFLPLLVAEFVGYRTHVPSMCASGLPSARCQHACFGAMAEEPMHRP